MVNTSYTLTFIKLIPVYISIDYSQAAYNSSIPCAMTYIASVINYVIDPLRGGTLSTLSKGFIIESVT